MVSDSDLIARLQEFLRYSDLNITTTSIVRRQLEKDFGIDLSDRKAFIREQVDKYLQALFENAEEDGESEGEDDNGDADDQTTTVISDEPDGSDDGGEDDGDDEASNRKDPAKIRSNNSNNEVKKRGGGFCKLCNLTPKLQEFLGVSVLARTEVVKQIWKYIRDNSLQDPSNRKNILCDEKLRVLFEVESIDMFQMNKALSKHIWSFDDVATAKSTPNEKQQKHEREEELDEPMRKEKRQKSGKSGSGFLAPLQLSEALAKFLGTGEDELTRADVIKRIWDYIKQNNLQDPSDKRTVLCDEKLKELFDVDSFHGFTVTKLLSAHFLKT